jgi:hypothetical protein
MTNELTKSIANFMAMVANYIYMEYGEYYHKKYISHDVQHMYDFTGSYYLCGFNTADTARYVVEFFKMNDRV